MIPIPPLRLGIPSPSDKSNKLIVVIVLGSSASNSWNNRDELFEKVLWRWSGWWDRDGCRNLKWTQRSQIEHGSSAEAGICRGVVGMTDLMSPEQSC